MTSVNSLDNGKVLLSQLPLSTAAIASYLYPALGGADARNEGGESRFSPLRSPIAGIIFYENYFL